MKRPLQIQPAEGKLGILLPGLGAVSTTFIAGCLLARRGLGAPIGSLTQLATIRLGKRTENRTPLIKEFAPLAGLDQLVFGAWDLFEDDAYQSAVHAEVLSKEHLALVKDEMEAIHPMSAVFYPEYVKRLHGTNVKKGRTKADMVEALREDIRAFKQKNGVSRAVAVWCGSTEIYAPASEVHQSIARFEKGLLENDPAIANSQMYAWACLKEGVPYANGAPNLTVDLPAAFELAKEHHIPIAGKDFKTGQTWMKTVVAPGLKARMLGLSGWFSTNILGNRDGEVLDDPENFKSKEVSKLGALEYILQPKMYEALYGKIFHKVRIEYYPRAATPKKDGTTSTSSDGSVTRCRSKSTFSAAIRSWQRRSCWTSRF